MFLVSKLFVILIDNEIIELHVQADGQWHD